MERIDLYYLSFKSNTCIEYISIKMNKYIKYIKINKYSLLEPSDKIAIFLGRHGSIIGGFSHPFFFFFYDQKGVELMSFTATKYYLKRKMLS